jgi:hypothetical protein
MALGAASGGSHTRCGAVAARCMPRTFAVLNVARVVAPLCARNMLERPFRNPLYFCTQRLIARGLLALAAQVRAGNSKSWHESG